MLSQQGCARLRRRVFKSLAAALILLPAVTLRLVADEKKKTGVQDSDEHVYDIGGDVQPPKLIHAVEPSFNPKSEEAFVSGVVKIEVVITTEGGTKQPKVLTGINERQDKEAIKAVEQWRFKPATRNGKPVNVRATVEVAFTLL